MRQLSMVGHENDADAARLRTVQVAAADPDGGRHPADQRNRDEGTATNRAGNRQLLTTDKDQPVVRAVARKSRRPVIKKDDLSVDLDGIVNKDFFSFPWKSWDAATPEQRAKWERAIERKFDRLAAKRRGDT